MYLKSYIPSRMLLQVETTLNFKVRAEPQPKQNLPYPFSPAKVATSAIPGEPG